MRFGVITAVKIQNVVLWSDRRVPPFWRPPSSRQVLKPRNIQVEFYVPETYFLPLIKM
jgi:hypothetical protein